MEEFDYVVAGGGTAGAVVAARLSEDPNVTVCLLEAGPSDVDDPAILRLEDWMFLLDSGYDWDYPVEPQEKGNSFLRHARAKVLGGCSSHNSCIAFWTPREDLDEWAAMGCEGWGADDTWPLIKRLETNDGPGDHHGRSGPVNLMTVPPDDPCGVAVLEAAAQAGLPTVRFNEGETVTNGAGWFQVNRSTDGTRMSSSVAYLHPIMATPVEPEGPHRLLGQAHRHRRGQARPRRRVHEPRPVHLLDGRRPPRGDPLLRVDRHAEGADGVRHRPGRPPARVRDRRARRQPRRRLQPRRPRRGHRDVGGRAADGQAVDPVVGDRPLHDDRGRPRPARPDDALRLGAVRHEHRPLGLPVGGERVLPDARTSAAAARAAPSACARPTSATACGSTRATSPTRTATTSA